MSRPPVEEQYEALRHGAGARVLARDGVVVSGPDAGTYLQGQLSQDVAVLEPGQAADSLVLSPQGKLVALVRVTRMGEESFLLDVDEGWGSLLATRLAHFKLRVKAELSELSITCLSARGPRSAEAVQGIAASAACSFSWGGATGQDLLFTGAGPEAAPSPDDATWPPGLLPCETAAWEALRVEAGIPVMGRELDERTIAAEAGLVERCVSFTKGCYTGQELVARLDARGSKVARRLVGFVLGAMKGTGDDRPPVGAVEVLDAPEGTTVGVVTSSARSPVLGEVALGYLHRRVDSGAQVWIRVPEGPAVAAQARSLPLLP